jgi:hypothetical protein
VGIDEVDLNRNHISWVSPLGRALMKSEAGDSVVFQLPDGTEYLTVLELCYKRIAVEPFREPPGSNIRFKTQGNDPKSFSAQTGKKVNPRVVSECYAKLLNFMSTSGCYPAQGADAEPARARAWAAYKDFFTLWKDADPDIPILKDAKAEYEKLQ